MLNIGCLLVSLASQHPVCLRGCSFAFPLMHKLRCTIFTVRSVVEHATESILPAHHNGLVQATFPSPQACRQTSIASLNFCDSCGRMGL